MLVELDGARLLIDPDRLGPLLDSNPSAVLVTAPETPSALGLPRAVPVRPGDVREVGGTCVRAVDGAQAQVWRDVRDMAIGELAAPLEEVARSIATAPAQGPLLRR